MDRREAEEKIASLGKLDEEFGNFMHKVNEVNSIIKKMASTDRNLQKIGDAEAKRYLGEETVLEDIDENQVVLKIANNRTVINKKAIMKEDSTNKNEMSQEAFMESVSKDAEMRYQDRLKRTEKMETFKKQATLAFRRGEFEKALVLYNKAIEQIKDSTLLYNNRALVYIKLGLLDRAKDDLTNWALRLNEDCLKSWLLLAKVNYLNGDQNSFEECILEAKKRNSELIEFIEDYVKTICEDGKN